MEVHMIKAVFLDFYGTVVHEDGDNVKEVCKRILRSSNAENDQQIGEFWWNDLQHLFLNSYGITFRCQRDLEYQSICDTLQQFSSSENAFELSNFLFEHWIKPPIFEDAFEFFTKCPLPIYIVSNIDNEDIIKAMEHHNLKVQRIFTSEEAKSYKPRKELFELALTKTGLLPKEVVHIGDSLTNDIKGAGVIGINTIWINRTGKTVPEGVLAVSNLLEVLNTDYFNNSKVPTSR